MSQNSLIINNVAAHPARVAINSALDALATNHSGPTEPTTTTLNMHWYDTSSNILKQRSEDGDAWISIGYFDQTANKFRILDDTQVVDTSGNQTGLLGDQATSEWESGLGTTQSLVSPANVKSAIDTALLSFDSYVQKRIKLTTGSSSGAVSTTLSTFSSPSITLPEGYYKVNGLLKGVFTVPGSSNNMGYTYSLELVRGIGGSQVFKTGTPLITNGGTEVQQHTFDPVADDLVYFSGNDYFYLTVVKTSYSNGNYVFDYEFNIEGPYSNTSYV